MAQANAYGSITIVDMTDIERIYVEYCRSTSNQLNTSVTPPVVPNITVNWSENTPPWVDGQYIWQRSVVKKSGSANLSYGTPVCLTGSKGGTGEPGQSLTATKTQYTNVASNVTITKNNHTSYTWTDSTPEYDATKPTYWGRITNTYSNPAKTEYLFYKDQALTDAIYNAYVANSIATHAQEDAEGALSQSAAAQQLATHVDTLLGGHFIFGGTLTSDTPGGARVVEQIEDSGVDVSSTPSKWHHNVIIGANGINLRYNEAVMAQLAANQSNGNTALTFYQPPTISGTTTIPGNPTMRLSGNALTFYNPTDGVTAAATLSSTGLNIVDGSIILGGHGATGTNNGDIALSNSNFTRTINGISRADLRFAIGSKFGVKNDGTLYASNATISGAITATSLSTGTKTSETTGKGIFINSSGAIYSGDGNVNNFIINEYGAITAKSGTIGGWNISATALSSATTYTPGSGRILLAPAGVTSSAIGNLPAATYAITAGTNFGVTTAGTLYATGAQIKGTITVTSGSDLSAGLTNYSTTAQISNTYSTKADAVRRTQRIYYYAPSEGEGEESTESETLSAPETPNSWISASSGVETWINQRIEEVPVGSGSETEPLSVENYPNVWVSEQTEMVNGDINCTPPKLDSISSIALDAQDLVNSLSDTINGENGLSEAIRLLTGSIIINPGDFTQTPPVEPSITIQTNSEEEGAETGKAALTLTSTQLILEKNDDAVITLDSTQDDGAIEANEIVLNSGLRIGNLEIIPYNGGIGIRAWEVEE